MLSDLAGNGGGAGEDAPADYLAYARTSNPVYACANLRAKLISGLPICAYRITPKGRGGRIVKTRTAHQRLGMPQTVRGARLADVGEVEQVTRGELVDTLTRVNPDWTFRSLTYMTEMSLCLAGQAFWRLGTT